MLLRRLTEHVKAQNWFAVGLDFFIVVLGVFVATQVANWNTARVERAQERQYLERLHGELAALITEQEEDRLESVETAARLTEIRAYFAAADDPAVSVPPASGPHCYAVLDSHIFAGDITLPPTISELISTGRILYVSDERLRQMIVRYAQAMSSHEHLRRDIQIDRMVLARQYPDFIRHSPAGWEQSSCDFPAMAKSPPFLNDFMDNSYRFNAYNRDVMQAQHDQRLELKTALGQALGMAEGAVQE